LTEPVLHILEGGVLTATLNRPDKRNAIDRAMVDALHDTLTTAELDAGVRVIVLRGAGPDFCAGMDLVELLQSVEQASEDNRRAAARFADIFLRMRRLPKPVVAAVHGRALAGGCGLVTACDLVVATESARFAYPEIARGFVPAVALALLRRTVGEKVAFDLAATGRTITAGEALTIGLCSRVFADQSFEAEVRAVLEALAAASGSALALLKHQFYLLDRRSLEDDLALGADVNAIARGLPEFQAGLAAFLNR
jgi:methylglutaconyl-CoA hydratase